MKDNLTKLCPYKHHFNCISGNIASYLKLLEVDSMYVPVPVNFIFIGFEGKGNQGMWYSIFYSLKVNYWFLFFNSANAYFCWTTWLFVLEFKLNPEELEHWFTNIDHIFEHSRIPQIGEVLTPFYKISIDREQHHHLPLVSHINYKYILFLLNYLLEYW